MMEFADRIPIDYSRYKRRSLLGVFQSAVRPPCHQRLHTLANSRVAVNPITPRQRRDIGRILSLP